MKTDLFHAHAIVNRLTEKEKLDAIQAIVTRAEEWCDKQLLPQNVVVIAALKDIRNVLRMENKE